MYTGKRHVTKASPSVTEQSSHSKNRPFRPLRSVGMKLFLLFFVSITLLVGSVGLFSYSQARQIIEQQLSYSQEQTVIQAGEKLDLFFSKYAELSQQILFDQDIQSALSLATQGQKLNDYGKLQIAKTIENNLKTYVFGNDALYGMYLIPVEEDGAMLFTSGLSAERLRELRHESWFKELLQQSGSKIWLPTTPNGVSGQSPNETFALARTVKSVNRGGTMYVMVMEIKSSVLKEQLVWNDADGSFVQMVSSEGKIVYAEDTTLIDQPPQIRLTAESSAQSGRDRLVDQAGNELLGVYYRSPVTNWTLNGFTPIHTLLQDTLKIRNASWTAIVIALVVALFIGWYVMRRIGLPLQHMRDLMEEGADGHLGVRMTERSQDEIGQVASSFNTMMSRISELVKQTGNASDSVLQTANKLSVASQHTALSAKEIVMATEEIAHGSTTLAEEAERGNEWTGLTSAKMQQVIELNVDMYGAASEVEQASQRGTGYMNELNRKTELSESMVRALVSKVDALQSSTASVRHILELLTQLAKQTNILSLNAAIEAVRAGASGRGFRVVADEIRGLADETQRSIGVVGEMTEKIGQDVEETVSMLGRVYPVFQEQLQAVQDTDTIFHDVKRQMGLFMNKLDRATEALNELDETQKVMTEAMTSVSTVAEEAAATSEEVASLSNEQVSVSNQLVGLSSELEQVSQHLSECLTQFALNNDD
ncbi:methyl-accepting chemotaxis protein [Paenibacillus sp. MER TA 81-3]|uniref:methyl-accepting chemotaxis protein n=1 Tax=Paenibacillus sp. MER TA 81-3 TaxID=2939573 RepID=UPI00204027DC|nr:methyl-accepting chemotaxis protein [Paenibacillus sp. MER TA 81-3]MCM3339495.1 methyl-accepting chemotaxis protein [Paenibacillus sp. MER TA 81-3]